MANTPKPPISRQYPTGKHVARWMGPGVAPPNVVPNPGPFASMKAALPKLPSATKLYHKPRQPGNG